MRFCRVAKFIALWLVFEDEAESIEEFCHR
jgi:hypothetical protein